MFFADTSCAHNQAHAIRYLEGSQCFADFRAVIPLDTTGYSSRFRVVWHKYQIAAGQADIGCESSTFIAALFLLHLDDDFGTFRNQILDGGLVPTARGIRFVILSGNFLKWQETVAFRAEIDEGGFQAWFNPSHFALVNIGFLLNACAIFDVQIV